MFFFYKKLLTGISALAFLSFPKIVHVLHGDIERTPISLVIAFCLPYSSANSRNQLPFLFWIFCKTPSAAIPLIPRPPFTCLFCKTCSALWLQFRGNVCIERIAIFAFSWAKSIQRFCFTTDPTSFHKISPISIGVFYDYFYGFTMTTWLRIAHSFNCLGVP